MYTGILHEENSAPNMSYHSAIPPSTCTKSRMHVPRNASVHMYWDGQARTLLTHSRCISTQYAVKEHNRYAQHSREDTEGVLVVSTAPSKTQYTYNPERTKHTNQLPRGGLRHNHPSSKGPFDNWYAKQGLYRHTYRELVETTRVGHS
ncbi:unnamed protein product [Ectocarpus fasciculatus]